jgi:hypothetical protein
MIPIWDFLLRMDMRSVGLTSDYNLVSTENVEAPQTVYVMTLLNILEDRTEQKTNSVCFSPQFTYTDRLAASYRRN